MTWAGAVLIIGPETRETAVVLDWGSRHAIRAARVPLSQALDIQGALACALVVLDALEDPPLAIAECARLHAAAPSVPLLFLSPLGRELEAAALRAGTTAFLERPMESARLHSYVGRFCPRPLASVAPPSSTRPIDLGQGVALSLDGRALVVRGNSQAITPDAWQLLEYFLRNPGRAISPSELVRKGILLASQAPRYRALVFDLRRKLGPARGRISLVRGFGYRFDLPAESTTFRGSFADGTQNFE